MMKTYRGKIDENVLKYVTERLGEPVAAMPCPIGENGQINPQTTRFLLKDGNFADCFSMKPIYYESVTGEWRPMSEVAVYFGNKRIELNTGWEKLMTVEYLRWLLIYMDYRKGKILIPSPYNIVPVTLRNFDFTTGTFYPDPPPYTTTCDGRVYKDDSNNWATTQSAASGSGNNTSGADPENVYTNKEAINYVVVRAFTSFDTSSIGSTATISSATYSIYGQSLTDNGGSIKAFGSTQTNNNSYVNGDYSKLVDAASDTAIALASFSTSSYNDYALNATGLTYISKTGVSKFGMRESYDYNNTTPTAINILNWHCSAASGTSTDPKLVVVYSLPAVLTKKLLMLMGIGS